MVDKRFISVSEAARRLNRDRVTIRRWFHNGLLPGRVLGKRIELEESRIVAIEAGADLRIPNAGTK